MFNGSSSSRDKIISLIELPFKRNYERFSRGFGHFSTNSACPRVLPTEHSRIRSLALTLVNFRTRVFYFHVMRSSGLICNPPDIFANVIYRVAAFINDLSSVDLGAESAMFELLSKFHLFSHRYNYDHARTTTIEGKRSSHRFCRGESGSWPA